MFEKKCFQSHGGKIGLQMRSVHRALLFKVKTKTYLFSTINVSKKPAPDSERHVSFHFRSWAFNASQIID